MNCYSNGYNGSVEDGDGGSDRNGDRDEENSGCGLTRN